MFASLIQNQPKMVQQNHVVLKFPIHEALTVSVNYGVDKIPKSELTMQSQI